MDKRASRRLWYTQMTTALDRRAEPRRGTRHLSACLSKAAVMLVGGTALSAEWMHPSRWRSAQNAGRSREPATHAWLTLACVPLLFGPQRFDVGPAFRANIATAALLAVSGNALLVHALKSADLSLLGPINAYKALVMQLATLLTFGRLQVGYSLALFQLSALISRVSGLPLFSGAQQSETALRIRGHGCGRSADRGLLAPGLARRRSRC